MSITQERLPTIGTVVDLVSLSANFPAVPQPEVSRENVVNTIANLVQENIYAAAIEGLEGIGKTTILSQFVRKHSQNTISLFVSAANRLSYDPDLIRRDVTFQTFFAATGKDLDRAQYDPALLKTYYGDLQHRARQRKQHIYFVVDGADELDSQTRDTLLQHLADILPLGIPQFRFLFSGDESLYRPLLNAKLSIKSFPLTEFGIEDTRVLFKSHALNDDTLRELNSICRGMPGRLTGALRAIEKGTQPEEIIKDAPSKWPEFFEIDWKQVDPGNVQLNRILALLAHDSKPHTIQDVAEALDITAPEVRANLATTNFMMVDAQNSAISFATSGLRKYAADRLKNMKVQIQKLLIKRLLASPQSDESILELPAYMEEAAEYADLLSLLTPEHIIKVLERTQTLSRVDDTVKRGLRSARNLGRDADILRFSLQQSVISDLANANVWESEVAALAALHRDSEALALANNAILREDRLQMLATLAHHIWLRGDPVPAEQLDQIRLLIDNLDFWSLDQRADHIASQLTCISPDLAATVLARAKRGTDEESLDRAFARSAVLALRELKDDQRRSQLLDSVARSRQNTKAHGLFEGVRVLSGKFTPEEVCANATGISQPDARISLLRYWCVLNGSVPSANIVATSALKLAVANPSSTLDASLLADLSEAIAGAVLEEEKRQLIGLLDGVRATAERLGPSVDYVRLQLALALSEINFDVKGAESRLLELSEYVKKIADLPSKGQAYAQFLGALRSIPSSVNFESGKELEKHCAAELEDVVLVLSESTADHYLALGGIIQGLAPGDLAKALDYTKIVNTEARRDAVLVDVVNTLLRKPPATFDPAALGTC